MSKKIELQIILVAICIALAGIVVYDVVRPDVEQELLAEVKTLVRRQDALDKEVRELGEAPEEKLESLTLVFLPGQGADLAKRKKEYGPFIEEVNDYLGFDMNIVVASSYETSVLALCTAKDPLIVGFGPATFFQAKEQCEVTAILREVMITGEYFRGVAIGKPGLWEKPFTLEQIKGKTVAFVSTGSSSGYVLPVVMLRDAGVRLEDLGEYAFLGSHPNVVEAVINGAVDVGFTYDGLLAKAANEGVAIEGENYEFLLESEPVYQNPWTVRASLPEAWQKQIRDAFTSVSEEALAKCPILEGFVLAKDADYDFFGKVYQAAKEIKE